MKINLSMRPKTVIATLEREWQMAVDAYIKNEGGKEVYDRKQDEYLAEALKTNKGFIPFRFFWMSPDGNMWCVFEHTTFDSGYAYTCSRAFCYHLTAGFGCIFLKCACSDRFTGKKTTGYICYESHFFERLHERGIYEWKGLDTLIKFVADNHGNTFFRAEPDSLKCDIRIGSAIGRGLQHRDCSSAFYIKTVLGDEHLTSRQRKITAFGRRIGDSSNKYLDLPADAVTKRLEAKAALSFANGKVDDFIQELIRDMAHVFCLPVEKTEAFYYLFSWMVVLVFTAKPSLGNKMKPDSLILLRDQALRIALERDVSNLDFFNLNLLVCSAVSDVSKHTGWNLSRGAVLRCSHNITKNLNKDIKRNEEK